MNLEGLTRQQAISARTIINKCIHSRLFFLREVLEIDLEDWQAETVMALDNGETKLSIRSGHGVGKTMLCGVLALHFLLFRDDVKIVVTSPSRDQMNDGLRPEINKWVGKLPYWMRASLEITSERIVRYPNPNNNFISFRTARKERPEALAGVHATHVMIIVDEASGVEEVIYETGQGALSTVGSIALLIGNPTNPNGFFYKTQTTLSDLWWTKRVSCMDSSRVSDDYIMSQARTYGVDSREYRVRVLGEFPDSGAESIIPRAFVMSALEREVDLVRGDIVWGLDPGRGGDPTGFVERAANQLVEYRQIRNEELMNLVGWVYNRYTKIPSSQRPKAIYVDSIGLGAGVADRLLELDLPVIHVNVSESASMSERFVNLRSELWYNTREWLESAEVSIVTTDQVDVLIEQLSNLRQMYTSIGKVKLESKDELKRRGLPSPNMADALALTFADNGAVRMGSYEDNWSSWNPDSYSVPNLV